MSAPPDRPAAPGDRPDPEGRPAATRGARPPTRLSQLRLSTWRGVLVRAVVGFQRDHCGDLAAALTYWSLLALFPAAIVVVSLVRLVATGPGALDAMTEVLGELTPDTTAAELEQRILEVVEQRASAGLLLSFGLLGAVWSASAYLRAFTRAANRIYEVEEGRPFYVLLPRQLALTVLAILLGAVILLGLLVSGPVARAVGGVAGLEQTAVAVWDVAKLPVLVVLAGLLLSMLYWLAPNVRQPRFRWVTVGGLVALLVWIVASAGFGLYVANFGAYDATYGSLGAVIVFLVWLFIGNCAVLLGVEINAELQRGRRQQAGDDLAPDAPPLPPRRSR